jgi:hypothetical protein
VSGEQLKISVGTPMIVSKSRSWHWYPSIRKIRDGSLLLVFSIMADALPESIVKPHHVMVRSQDNGNSWHFHRYLYFPTTVAGDAHVCAQLSDGIVLELPNNVHVVGDEEYRVPYWKSDDDGKTFLGPYDARLHLPRGSIGTAPAMGRMLASVRIYRSIVELDNGDLLASMYGKFKREKKYRSFVVKSTDCGENWSYLSTIAYDPKIGTEGFCEPVMGLLQNGEILCVMRTGSGEPLYQSASSDHGERWSNPVPTGARGVDPDLVIMKSGIVACSYGRLQPRKEIEPSISLDPKLPASMGVQIMFSTDEGASWTNHATIYTGPSTGYTGIEEIRQGELIQTFDTLGYGWHPYNTIRTVNINVR